MAHVSVSALAISAPHSSTGAPISISPLAIIIITRNVVSVVIESAGLGHLGDGTVIEDLTAVVSSSGVEVSFHSPGAPGVLDDHSRVGISGERVGY